MNQYIGTVPCTFQLMYLGPSVERLIPGDVKETSARFPRCLGGNGSDLFDLSLRFQGKPRLVK